MTEMVTWAVLAFVCGALFTVILGAWNIRGWIEDGLRSARHSKDNELQELQGQIDVLQLQIRELQIACKSLNGNHFTRTPSSQSTR